VIDARTDRTGVATLLRRRSILQGAVTAFALHGYAGASTREIAEQCRLKQGHVYYYFPAKQDILYTIVSELHDSFIRGIRTWENQDFSDPVEKLRAVLVGHVLLLCQRHQETFVSYENFRFLEPRLRLAIIRKRRTYERRLLGLVEACGPRSNSVPTEVITKAILGIVNWPYQWYSPGGQATPDSLALWLADIGVSALGLMR
jgi:TetR/AcrR family transcriptional regulator, cholesterol catabolism regulator